MRRNEEGGTDYHEDGICDNTIQHPHPPHADQSILLFLCNFWESIRVRVPN